MTKVVKDAVVKGLIRGFSFFNQAILRNTKEDSVNKVAVGTIIKANLIHEFRFLTKRPLKLQYPNDVMLVPLPNKWSNPDQSLSKQQTYMVIKQVGLNLKKAGMVQRSEINADPDRSRGCIRTLNLLGTIHDKEIDNVEKIYKNYNLDSEVAYLPERELTFGDCLVSGEVSYYLRKYGADGEDFYDLPESRQIDVNYRAAFEKALREEEWNDNVSKLGLTRAEVIKRVADKDGIYTMFYQHMEKQSGGNVIITKPELYCDNLLLDQIYYMHVTYPILMKVPSTDGGHGFVCIGIGIRHNDGKNVRIFSPFFKNQSEPLWRIAQSHVATMAINDFSVRVHLGIYHFTSNQYHVPIYRLLDQLKGREKDNYSSFISHTYAMFSRGLDGVNVSAVASLVHPIPKYSIVSKALNVSPTDAISIITETSNALRIFEYDPRTILRKQGISEQEVNRNFPKMALDFKLYDILSDYIAGVYNAFHNKEIENKILQEIIEQTRNMAVNHGPHRPHLRNTDDVLRTLQNLCFIWVGFHQHTFSEMTLAAYNLMRPSKLALPIPEKEEQIKALRVGQELPDSKNIMQFGKLTEATTQRDCDNYLLDNIRRQVAIAADRALMLKEKDEQLAQSYAEMHRVASKTLQRLIAHEKLIAKINEERAKSTTKLSYEWMYPSTIQTSLNI